MQHGRLGTSQGSYVSRGQRRRRQSCASAVRHMAVSSCPQASQQAAPPESSPDVGSSRKRSCGRVSSSTATHSRLRSPPLMPLRRGEPTSVCLQRCRGCKLPLLHAPAWLPADDMWSLQTQSAGMTLAPRPPLLAFERTASSTSRPTGRPAACKLPPPPPPGPPAPQPWCWVAGAAAGRQRQHGGGPSLHRQLALPPGEMRWEPKPQRSSLLTRGAAPTNACMCCACSAKGAPWQQRRVSPQPCGAS